jgi:hypothetical protein
MALVFCDSFDPYTTFLQKWSSGSAALSTAQARTGTQSLNPSIPGFANQPRINFAVRQTLIVGVAYLPQGYGVGGGNQILGFFNTQYGGENLEVDVLDNGAIEFLNPNGTIATSEPGAIQLNVWNYVEVKAQMFPGGTYECRVNGQVVLSVNANVPAFNGADGCFLFAAPSSNQYFDDFYLLDDTGGVNDDYLGAVQIYAILPDADETPLDWTPLSGENFANVDTAPPPGDSSYVASNTAGDIDQYHYTITGPSGSYSIKAMQHSLCCRLDSAGSHTISSQINAATNAGPQVGSDSPTGDYVYAIFPWDENPNTDAPFEPTDFSSTFVGPILTT